MIQVNNISFSHSGELLYQDASFSLPKGKKAGLVGLNGAGKSTLFRLLLKEEWPDEGKVRVEGTVALVPQEVKRDLRQESARNIREYLLGAKPLSDKKMLDLMKEVELNDLSLDESPKNLSGGQKTKLALIYALLIEPDILLLDEPTNFLDSAGKKWVMHFLANYKKSLLIVSHDLDLLDQHIDKVVYINKQTRQFEEYRGTYSQFKKLKADRDEHLTRYIKNQQQKMMRLKKSVERLRRSNVEKVIRQRVNLERRILKMEVNLPQLPQEVVNIKLHLPTPAHIGSLPLLVKDLQVGYEGNEILSGVNFSIQKGQRIALIGQNGVGKTTLIKTIMGEIEPTNGLIRLDNNAKIGYYSQEFESFEMGEGVFETILKTTQATEGQVRAFLAKFMFTRDAFKQQVGTLSGGEKTRLAIALLMLRDNNFLILDEPTTYLDVLSQRIILEALKLYQGTMMVVSHTPDFLKELKPHKALLLPEEDYVFWDDALLTRASEM